MSEEKEIFKNGLLDKLKNKNFTIYYYSPAMNFPSGGMAVLFKQARILKDAGYNVSVIFEPRLDERASYQASTQAKKRIFVYERFNPTWMDVDYSDIPLLPQLPPDENANPNNRTIRYTDGKEEPVQATNINPEDFLIIPEGYANVMAQLANATCKKIVFAQSWIYILNSLQAGQTWESFGIKDCISISDGISEYINSIMPGVKVKQYSQSINRKLFYKPSKLSDKKPVVAFSCSRGPENKLKTYNIIKTFQTWYPHYKWVRFIELGGLSKEEFAERMREASIFIDTDEIKGFGTAAPEAMASGTHVVGFANQGNKEYVNAENGFWANNGDIFQTAELLGIAVDKLLNGEMDIPEIQQSYEKTLSRYTEENEKNGVLKIYEEYLNERIDEISKL